MQSVALPKSYDKTTGKGYAESRGRDEMIDAYTLGKLDALDGEMACPEMYVVSRLDKELYCAGYESVAGPSETTRHFLDSAKYVFAGVPQEANADEHLIIQRHEPTPEADGDILWA